ncbi:hypothetical protein [Mangrovihabitans endophyticus]|uniref:Uncharacterized protein n=1 Tax=Mangrovihabitans endophyticus TaxID=1751298 RepID=A0A8J3BYD5_9ACTN|nr:hypothetical protein [Mangrovihabitans endophyticus]GGK82536.1 hypothetical protein GCM10012284_15640 [Mangrovihabitans endophyticus]
MADDLTLFAGGVTGAAGAIGVASIGLHLLRRPGRYLPGGHAVVSDAVRDPLPAVLRRGLAGMTVPVWPGPTGELFLGRGAARPGHTLRRRVLAPLSARAGANGGRLCRDQRVPFRLVIEFAGAHRDPQALLRAYRKLDQQLHAHAAVLSCCDDGRLTPGAVTVAVSGIVDARELLAAERTRYAFVDGSFDDVGSSMVPPTLAPMISEPWSRRFGWDGQEPIPAEERHLLHAMVRAAHADGRTVRITGLSQGSRRARRAIWIELAAAGVDVIADADQRGLARHLRRRSTAPAQTPTRTAPSPRLAPAGAARFDAARGDERPNDHGSGDLDTTAG